MNFDIFFQALQDDIVTLQTNMNNIVNTGSYFVQHGDPEMKQAIENQMSDLKTRWETITQKAIEQNDMLKTSLSKTQKVIIIINSP